MESPDPAAWPFQDPPDAAVLLGEIVQFDPTLLDLADLPSGWRARREALGAPWVRREGEPG